MKQLIFTTPVWPTSYDELTDCLYGFAQAPHATAIEFTNTHVTALRKYSSKFNEATNSIDHFVPDGQPLVWILRSRGCSIKERVYGPTFMRRFITKCPETFTHYLLGGTRFCGTALHHRLAHEHPNFCLVGSNHGLPVINGLIGGTREQDQKIIDEINTLQPDFIWVAFGTPNQQLWISRNKHKMRRGVILGVGFAFDVLAGTKRDAPELMQRLGLTWLFRLLSEPRRLAKRYFLFNSLFLWYFLNDLMRAWFRRFIRFKSAACDSKK